MLFSNPDYCELLVIRDKSWLFSDNSNVSNSKIVSNIPDAVPSTKKALGFNILFNVVFYADHTNTITYIKYTKIKNVLSN